MKLLDTKYSPSILEKKWYEYDGIIDTPEKGILEIRKC